jgi:hypothetical protein
MMMRAYAAGLLLALGAGCAPLTFSKEADVDFETYQNVRVELGGPDGSRRQRDYLADELSAHSGFRRILREPTEPVDARLLVELSASSDADDSDFALFDSEEEGAPTYTASVHYRLEDAYGSAIDAGAASAEATDYFEATESALDLVVLHYLRPYRL